MAVSWVRHWVAQTGEKMVGHSAPKRAAMMAGLMAFRRAGMWGCRPAAAWDVP